MIDTAMGGHKMEEQLLDYLHYLTIERGLSQNTRISYQRDLTQYLEFLKKNDIQSWQEIDRFTVVQFLQKLQEEKKSSATVTRMITSLRRFQIGRAHV